MKAAFSKYEGIGNDIVVFDFPAERLGMTPARLRRFLRLLCDRRLGVGADEVAFCRRAGGRAREVAAEVDFYNSDGSRARICGNGLRCVAARLVERRATGGARDFIVGTGAGPRRCLVRPPAADGGHGAAARVAVGMGRALPLGGAAGPLRRAPIEAGGETLRGVPVSVGNPHVVFFGRSFTLERMDRVGRALQRHRLFPGGVNVGFAVAGSPRGIDLVVYERGCGFTLACGSGACAATAAAAALGLVTAGRPVAVRLPGGTLSVTAGSDGALVMEGPARRTFEGTLRTEELLSGSASAT